MSESLDIENAKIIDMYERLFAERGWKELIEDLTERIKAAKDNLVNHPTSSEKDLYFVKGMTSAFRYIIELENMVDTAKKNGMLDDEKLPGVLN